jgi:hypothetical protein
MLLMHILNKAPFQFNKMTAIRKIGLGGKLPQIFVSRLIESTMHLSVCYFLPSDLTGFGGGGG